MSKVLAFLSFPSADGRVQLVCKSAEYDVLVNDRWVARIRTSDADGLTVLAGTLPAAMQSDIQAAMYPDTSKCD